MTCRTTGANSDMFSTSPPKPPSKPRRNAPHPTTRKRPRETCGPFGRESRAFFVSGRRRCDRRKLTYGNLVAIPAIAETKNTRRYREDLWLGREDSNSELQL